MAGELDIETELQWGKTLKYIEKTFGHVEEVNDVIFLIGVQELGKGYQTFTKDQKVDIMHIGLCAVLESFGFYEFEGLDSDGWPHWKNTEALPSLSTADQTVFIKKAIIDYFNGNDDPIGP